MRSQRNDTAAKNDQLAALAALAALAPNNGPRPQLVTEPVARTDLALIDGQIAKVEDELSQAERRYLEAIAEGDEVRSQIAALGGEPQPESFETARDWTNAKDEWVFDLAKLRPRQAAADARQIEAANDLAEPRDRLAILRSNRQRVVVEHTLADLDDASATFVAALRKYNTEFRKLEGGAANGLWVIDRQQLLRGFTSLNFGNSERIELVMVAPYN